MIDIKLKYHAVAFMQNIEASQKNISEMMRLFSDRELLPTTYYEEPAASSIQPEFTPLQPPLFSLQSPNPNSNGFNIRFGIDKVEVIKDATDVKGSNLGTIEQFSSEVADIFTKILSKYPQKANRLALLSSVILKEMNGKMLDEIYVKLFNPIQLFNDNKPVEWSSQTLSLISKQICDTDETFNFVSEVSRVNGQLNISQEVIPIDRIVINLEINTILQNTQSRFDEAAIIDFYSKVQVWHEDLMGEFLKKIE